MANVAVIFHWPPSEMDRMTVPELMTWEAEARLRAGEAD